MISIEIAHVGRFNDEDAVKRHALDAEATRAEFGNDVVASR